MIKAILVDDEPYALTTLKNKLAKIPEVEVIGSYLGNDFQIDVLNHLQANVIFLDIEMGFHSGLELADKIQEKFPNIQIVFVTAHNEYAVKAFEIDSLDYLLKPVTTTRLKKTINRLLDRLNLNSSMTIDNNNSTFVINCFNEFQFLKDNLPISFKTVKVKELLAFFIMHKNTPIHRDVLIESLWPDQDYSKSKIHFHTCLSHLRKLLKNLGFNNCISLVNHSYIFSMDNIIIDYIQFEELFKTIGKIDDTTISKVEKCLELYKGPLFNLNHYDWAEAFISKFTNDYGTLLEKLANYYAKNDQSKMLFYLQLQFPLFPYNDEKVEKCMQLLYKHGYHNEAIKIYVEYEERLHNDLAILPSTSLKNLYKQNISERR